MSKPKFAANTDVSPEQSMSEIRSLLKRYGATRMAIIEDMDAIGVTFEIANRAETRIRTDGSRMGDVQADQAYEKAIRQRWRALVLVIKAKLESVESGIETLEQAFLAQIVIPADNRTVGQWLAPQLEAAYSGTPQPFLLPSGGSRAG